MNVVNGPSHNTSYLVSAHTQAPCPVLFPSRERGAALLRCKREALPATVTRESGHALCRRVERAALLLSLHAATAVTAIFKREEGNRGC